MGGEGGPVRTSSESPDVGLREPRASPEPERFAVAGPTSDLGRHRALASVSRRSPIQLAEVVRGLLLHDVTAQALGIESSPERDGMRAFGAGPVIARVLELDDSPLDQPRRAAERLIGYCYHFALLHCALLRAQGTPARARCGFASYLGDGWWTDHWVTEHWDGRVWRRCDPQIGLDELTHDHFRDGVRAWKLCRAGDADPFAHGIGNLWGWDELRGSSSTTSGH